MQAFATVGSTVSSPSLKAVETSDSCCSADSVARSRQLDGPPSAPVPASPPQEIVPVPPSVETA